MTSPSTSPTSSNPANTGGRAAAATPSSPQGSALVTEQGRTSIADSVVTKVAGIATRQIDGVYNLGTGGTRAFGAIRQRVPGTGGPDITQGVSVDVGERQAAIDLDVVVEYGVSIVDLAEAIRRNVINSVQRMTGLQVTEVNIAVDDIHVASDDGGQPSDTPPRVQ